MPWQRKERVKTTSSLNGPFFRPEFKNHPWRCSSSWEDRMLRQSSSFRTFTSCRKLLSLSANTLVFSCYRATDTGQTRLFPRPPVTARLLPSPSCQKVKSLFLHQRNSIMQGQRSRGEQLWPLALPPGYTREVHPVSSLGQVDKNRPSEVFQDIAFPLTGKSVDKAVFLWWNVNNVKLFVNINNGSWQPTFKWRQRQ